MKIIPSFNSIIEYFFGKKSRIEFEEMLKENECKKNLEGIIKESLLHGAVAATILFSILIFLEFPFFYSIIFSLTAFFAPLILQYSFQLLLFEKRKREKERMVPDLLLQASLFPRGTATTKIISYMAKTEFGLLSKEFKKVNSEIRKGASIEKALSRMQQRCKSKIVERAADLLIQGHSSGAEMHSVFKETAEDVLETQSIIRERNATTTIEKYTVLMAAAIIVPLILGLIVGLIEGLNFQGIAELSLGLSSKERKALLEAALTANFSYIIEYSLIASIFISHHEGNKKKAIIYSLILIPASIITYTIARAL
ncbi:MAG: type II secretion system F family protein [Candidatus Diapherotrites archaeon]